jgi:hypothetical protein
LGLLAGAAVLAAGGTGMTTREAKTAAPTAVNLAGVTAAEGTSASFARADHVHSLTGLLSVEQGGGGKTTGASFMTPRFATFVSGTTTWVTFGLSTQAQTGTAAAARPNSSGPGGIGQRIWISYTSSGATNAIAGIVTAGGGGGGDALAITQSRFLGNVFTDISTASRRCWFGLTSSALTGSGGHIPPTASAAFATQYVGFGFDPAVNSGRIVAASGDGTNETGVDTGVVYTNTTNFTFDIDMSKHPTSISMGVNGTYITKTANLPDSLTNGTTLFVEQFCVATAAIAVIIYVAPYEVWN